MNYNWAGESEEEIQTKQDIKVCKLSGGRRDSWEALKIWEQFFIVLGQEFSLLFSLQFGEMNF